MFETLMRHGGYRVDYINHSAAGIPDAFGFYVRGDFPHDVAYSVIAKRHLAAGLEVIQRKLDRNLLVAVYVDVVERSSRQPMAYLQLLQDLRAGLFHRVFVYQSLDLLDNPDAYDDFEMLASEIGQIEILHFDTGVLEKMTLCDFERVME